MSTEARQDRDAASAGTGSPVTDTVGARDGRSPPALPPGARPEQPRKQRRKRRRRWRRVLESTAAFVGVALLLVGLVASAVHVRLSHGAIPLGLFTGWIKAGIDRDLAPWTIGLTSATLVRGEARGLEIELAGVLLEDERKREIVSVPLVRIRPSFEALWRGQLVAEHIAVVGARVSLGALVSDAGGQPAATRLAGEGAAAASGSDATTGSAAEPARLDLARLLADASERARDGRAASGYLRSFGLENASVVVGSGAGRAEWRIPDLVLDLEHRQKRSAFALEASLGSTAGPWKLAVQIDDREKAGELKVDARIRGLVPRGVAETHSGLAVLRGLAMPVDADVVARLGRDGRLDEVTIEIAASAGTIVLPGMEHAPVAFEAARVRGLYTAATRRLVIEPSPIIWEDGRATLSGEAELREKESGEPVWTYRLGLADPASGEDRAGRPAVVLDEVVLEGTIRPDTGRFEMSRGRIGLGGGGVEASGWSEQRGSDTIGSLSGRLERLPVAALTGLWPRRLSPLTRTWVVDNVRAGTIEAGSFKVENVPARTDGPPREHASLTLDVRGTEVVVQPTLPPIAAATAKVRVEGEVLEVTVPEAGMPFARGRRLSFREGRYTVAGMRDPQPLAELSFRVQGPLTAAAEAVERVGIASRKAAGLPVEGVDGKVDGELRLQFVPPKSGPLKEMTSTLGRFRIGDVRARNVIPGYPLTNATIEVGIDDRAIEVQGDLLVQNLPVKLAWQRLLGSEQAKSPPPPVRLSMRLDTADRAALGLDIEHWVRGEVPVEIVLEPTPEAEPKVRVFAGLTAAELALEAVAWRKPAGQNATLEFEVVRAGKQRTELQGLRLRGEGIAIDGTLAIGPDNKLREVDLPVFSVGVVGNLAVKAALGSDKVWRVKAKGPTFDGQDYFRALLAGPTAKPTPARVVNRRDPIVVLELEIGRVVGFHETTLAGLKIETRRQGSRLLSLEGRGTLDGGAPLTIRAVRERSQTPRVMVATGDAGRALKLVGLYSAMSGGSAELALEFDDDTGKATRGTLAVRRFTLLGQPVVVDVARSAEEGSPRAGGSVDRRIVRETIPFDALRLPFRLEPGHVILTDTRIEGPLIGATLRGRIGLADHRLALAGTFTPLRGINAALAQIPLLGELLTGSRGEGIIAVNFALQGSLEQPEVIVHPLSPMAPGILRELFPIGPEPFAAGTPGRPTTESDGPRVQRPGTSSASPQSAPGRVLDGWSTESRKARGAGTGN